jgi:hypothetical protein
MRTVQKTIKLLPNVRTINAANYDFYSAVHSPDSIKR